MSQPLSNLQARDLDAVLHPYSPLHKLREIGPTIMASGKGVFITDTQGNEYIEGMAGLWCTGLGFGNEEMIDAATEQMRTLPYYHQFSGRGTEPAIELAEKLKELSPFDTSKVFYTSSGSEANDTQVKLAWYYNNALGRPKKKKIISRMKAYHGVTLMAASLTGLPANHMDFDLPFDGVLHTDCPHHYRFGHDGESEGEFVARLAKSLEDLIEREGGDTIAAMIAEPVMGAGGVIVPPSGYFEAIQPILKQHDILLIDDEVINGFGRTGEWFGASSHGMVPDTISVAKQMTSAYAPLGAVMIPQFMMDALEDQSRKIGVFGHGYTYGGHPLGCAMGVKAIEIYQRMNIVQRVRDLTPLFEQRLAKLRDHPLVGEVRNSGLVGGVELVSNKATKQAWSPTQGVGAHCATRCQAHGVILRPIGDTIAICPPMIITEDELNELFDRLELALDDTEHWANKEGLRAA
ncbi:aminotransferase [Ahrensia sp. R2A130]|uniref:aminotransferase n=1 Tax=Ahrensia sp. R2A130 TaxID=744979 RepID=UPI0001E0D87D|nr:aminotransferase [Ahrensia sp. R2A130]EFL88909.1 aminotransferase class-III [Ahrensia sp. R2A130]